MMKIIKRDRDVELFSCYADVENPSRLNAKRSSNAMFLICALLFGISAIFYVMLWNQNTTIKRDTDVAVEYINNPEIIKVYNEKMVTLDKIKKIQDYNQASETYLAQLESNWKISSEWIEFFDTALTSSVGGGGKINAFQFTGEKMILDCTVRTPEQPKLYAKYLSELKDENGQPMFQNVNYTGFSDGVAGNNYVFTLNVTLWNKFVQQ